MPISIKDAAKGAPEMGFWPAAASILIYSRSPSHLHLGLLLVLLFAGSITSLAIRRGRLLLEQYDQQDFSDEEIDRNAKVEAKSDGSIDVLDFGLLILPEGAVSYWIVAIMFLLNTVAGMLLFGVLLHSMIISNNPNPAVVGLTVLPLVWICVVLSIVIWNID